MSWQDVRSLYQEYDPDPEPSLDRVLPAVHADLDHAAGVLRALRDRLDADLDDHDAAILSDAIDEVIGSAKALERFVAPPDEPTEEELAQRAGEENAARAAVWAEEAKHLETHCQWCGREIGPAAALCGLCERCHADSVAPPHEPGDGDDEDWDLSF